MEEEETLNWRLNLMPDKVTVTPASGKLEFFNDDGTEIASIEAEHHTGDSSNDRVKLEGVRMDGGTF